MTGHTVHFKVALNIDSNHFDAFDQIVQHPTATAMLAAMGAEVFPWWRGIASD